MMELTANSILRKQYNVIVVGAGLGGLTAASLLARRGLSVLLVDRQSKPGGACTSFKRKDVVFDVGEAMLYGFGDKGFKPFHFLMNELDEPIDMVAHPTLARMTIEGQPLVFWPDLEKFIDQLAEIYPQEREGLHKFYRDLYKLYEHIVIKKQALIPPSEYTTRQLLNSLLPNPFKMARMQKLLTTSTLSLLKRYFHSDEIIDFYDKLCSAYCYCTAEEMPAVLAATMFLDNHFGGVYYPAGGAQMLPNKIEKAFERDGGHTLYGVTVDEILIQAGAAYGVRLENGQVILADQVIANATVWNLYGSLVRPEHIPPERLAWAKALVPTFPSMTLYMTVDRQALPDDILPWEVFIENRQEIDSQDLTLYINSLVDETLGPRDQLVIMAISPNFCGWPPPGDPEYRSANYYAQKNREVQRMIDQIESHFPGFRSHIRTLIAGTPSTIERYLLKNGGAVGGPKNQIGQEMLKRLHARGEWKNLYVCGDSTVMGTGAPAAAVSGFGAANLVLRDLRMKEYSPRKFPDSVINFVDLPHRRPQVGADEPIDADNAWLYAAQCQWCEEPDCVRDCPAKIDIPGFLRRMEAQNYLGAARVIRRRNPFGETCGYTCGPNPACQRDCYRRRFSGRAVRIADLQRWVCQAAGPDGWLQDDVEPGQRRLAMIGCGPALLSCAYYLCLTGLKVELYSDATDPAAEIYRMIPHEDLPQAVVERDVRGKINAGVEYHPVQSLPDEREWMDTFAAMVVTDAQFRVLPSPVRVWEGLFALKEFPTAVETPVQAAAEGRRTAEAVHLYLRR